jgi:hypothetical protein
MTRMTILLICIFSFLFMLMFMPAAATGNRHESSKKEFSKSTPAGANAQKDNKEDTPWLPDAQPARGHKERQQQKTEELAHIHHFHKERVKKVSRHHSLIWMISKILITICHLVLLLCAFLHLSH